MLVQRNKPYIGINLSEDSRSKIVVQTSITASLPSL